MKPIFLLTVLFAAALAAETLPKKRGLTKKSETKRNTETKTETTPNAPKNNRKRSYVSPPPRSPRPTYGAPLQTQYQQKTQKYQQPAQQYQPAAPAPQYQPAAPAPQYQSAAPAPQYQSAAPVQQYQPAAPAPQYQPAAPAPQYQPAAPASQYQPAAPAPQYQPAAPAPQYQQTPQYQQSSSYGSSQGPAISTSYSSVGSSGNGYGSTQGQYGSSYSSSANVIPITSYRQTIKGAQENTYSFETGNGIKQQESTIVRPGYGDGPSTLIKSGSVQYTSPDGSPVSLSWVADQNGFQPSGAHLPVAPAGTDNGAGGYGSSASYSAPAAPSSYGQQSSGGYSAPAAPSSYGQQSSGGYSAPSSYGQAQSQPQSYAAPAVGSGWGQ